MWLRMGGLRGKQGAAWVDVSVIRASSGSNATCDIKVWFAGLPGPSAQIVSHIANLGLAPAHNRPGFGAAAHGSSGSERAASRW